MLIVPAGRFRIETRVLNSRFLATLDYADSPVHAREVIAGIRHEFPEATHHVPAFLCGGGSSSIEFCSDDGEPSGTSGRPLLAVLRGSGLGNAVVVVSRWFGGTLLGTGGLVKAYSEAGKAVLACAERATLEMLIHLQLCVPYGLFESIRMLCASSAARIVSEEFAESVTLIVELPQAAGDVFAGKLADLSAGSIHPLQIWTGTGRTHH